MSCSSPSVAHVLLLTVGCSSDKNNISLKNGADLQVEVGVGRYIAMGSGQYRWDAVATVTPMWTTSCCCCCCCCQVAGDCGSCRTYNDAICSSELSSKTEPRLQQTVQWVTDKLRHRSHDARISNADSRRFCFRLDEVTEGVGICFWATIGSLEMVFDDALYKSTLYLLTYYIITAQQRHDVNNCH